MLGTGLWQNKLQHEKNYWKIARSKQCLSTRGPDAWLAKVPEEQRGFVGGNREEHCAINMDQDWATQTAGECPGTPSKRPGKQVGRHTSSPSQALCTCEAALRFRAVPWDRAGPGGYLPAGKKISCLLAWDRLLVQCTSAYALRPNRTVVAAAQKLACEVHRWAAQNPLWNRLRPFLTGQYREMLSHSRKVLRHHPSAVMIACCRHYGGKQTAQLCELKKRQQFDLISNDCAVPVGLAGRSLITGFN